MKICREDQALAAQIGESIWVWDGVWYQIYQDKYNEWSVNCSWGWISEYTELHILSELVEKGIKIEQRHLDAIKRVDAPAEQVTVGVDWAKVEEHAPPGKKTWYPGCCEVDPDNEYAIEERKLSPVEDIVWSLMAAREISDEEHNMGFVTDSESGDMYKVTVQYIGNRSK